MDIGQWLEQRYPALSTLADDLWAHPELALTEKYAAQRLSQALRENGFTVQTGLGGMETAFSASWGDGGPVLALLGEYDALSGLSQRAIPRREPAEAGGAGHGCGHNLLGVAPLGAALALQAWLTAEKQPGRIVYFGCPAEETMTGKIRMAAAGCFDGMDAALAWHPWAGNFVMTTNMLAMNTAKFTFSGTPAHASAAPERGRSALDAVELMNTGVNYLREHIPGEARVHYAITDGGGEPNIVPARAQSWYYIRAPRRQTVEEVFDRVCDVARGAALMTGVRAEIQLLTGCWNLLPNKCLNRLVHACMEGTPLPEYTREEQDFAAELTGRPGSLGGGVGPLREDGGLVYSSTDVADVSWLTPTVQFGAACVPAGVSPHSWQFTACAGMGIGHKGMLYAAKVLTETARRLLTDPALLAEVRGEFENEKNGTVYRTVTGRVFD